MQICRMMDDRPRSFRAKLIESFRALQLERLRSKDAILETYLNLAPYGRNLRGVEAAALAWFGRPASDLSLPEAALLAGLPQSPARYRPDRHPQRAKARRNTVLRRMLETGVITRGQWRQAVREPLVLRPVQRCVRAPQAAWLALQRRPLGGRTTIDADLQADAERLVDEHVGRLPEGTDVAVLVMDIPTGDILALVGSADPADPVDGQVNGTVALRSPGSTLKPFVYAAAFQSRRLAPDSTVYDIRIDRAGWSPENFDGGFRGPLSVAEALQRSLNVPAILTAEAVGLPRCAGLIESAGVTLPDGVLAHGGLAVVTGAVEVTLLDLVTGYATLGRGGIRQSPRLFPDEPITRVRAVEPDVCAALDDILSSRRRRPRGMGPWSAEAIPWFTWKTGTSSRRRDAWAVGHNRKVAAGVWVGRFSGAGCEAYVGALAAEPLLAALFALPGIRSDIIPAPPAPWPVREPLPRPVELEGPLRILGPRDGARFVALAGGTIIRPRANREDGLTWFLNGRMLARDGCGRLTLPPGRFELRCVARDGPVAVSRFDVLPP
jgi:penicillin-binding protein 1C